ncbi:sensor histidine kinase [Anaeromyxobacter diazotrophicus]|uniref:histidine kinase n=1 Tax=Anaeromyxobacter diazotrophicus TaxID=2590199 RepID=A0A7I9VQJ1_9BACT|nr:HAMP domain-containing histidine kinase [Anaeromyxobacter diazotrophicus]GEJ58247.1 hypothetical protein AMYX_29880 [Anaeromyxobacter diazotrophicus]
MIVSDRQQPRGAEGGGAGASPGEKSADRGSFLGFVAHEMRNPLSTALWSAELLARLAPEDRAGPRGEKLSNMCLRALQRLRLLVEDHFLAERLGVDGIPFRSDAVPVREMLEQVAGKLGVEAKLAVDETLAVRADRGLLERVLDALLAVASHGKSPVHIDAQRSGETVTLTLRGAPPAPGALEMPHKGTPSDPTGRALALHMAVQVAQALGGTLTAPAEAYLLTLPLAPAPGGP